MSKSVDSTIYFEDNRASEGLGRKALHGGVMSVLSRCGNGAIQIGSAVMLARLLAPEDFGLVAMVTVLTSFGPLLVDFGLGDATTQRSNITQKQVSTLFWVSSGIGLAIWLLLAVFSPLIAWIYHEPRLQPIALWSGATFFFLGISGQHLALLRRNMRFREIAKIEILSNLAGAAIAVAIAVTASGYWALVARPIISAALFAVGVWLTCSWRPGMPGFDKEVKSMLRFGMHVVGFSLTYFGSRAADRVSLGLFFTARDVGFYQNALNLYENSILSLLQSFHNVGSTALSKLQSTPQALKEKYSAALSTLTFFCMPASAILSVTGQDIVVLLLGAKWRAAGAILNIIALRGIVHPIDGSQGWLHLSTGRPDRWMKWGIVTTIVQVVTIAAGLPFGPKGVAAAFVVGGWIIALPAISYAGRPVGIGARNVLAAVGPQLTAAVITAAAGWWLQLEIASVSAPSRIILSLFFCISVYLLIVVGLFQVTEPLKVIGKLGADYVPAKFQFLRSRLRYRSL